MTFCRQMHDRIGAEGLKKRIQAGGIDNIGFGKAVTLTLGRVFDCFGRGCIGHAVYVQHRMVG